jgi:putative FmdB family regulatory protein
MPAYDYRCTLCGREMEIIHPMRDTVSAKPHDDPRTGEPCEGGLERLISKVGFNAGGLTERPPSDDKLKSTGFTKYVRGSKGYEKAFGSGDTPDFIQRESN